MCGGTPRCIDATLLEFRSILTQCFLCVCRDLSTLCATYKAYNILYLRHKLNLFLTQELRYQLKGHFRVANRVSSRTAYSILQSSCRWRLAEGWRLRLEGGQSKRPIVLMKQSLGKCSALRSCYPISRPPHFLFKCIAFVSCCYNEPKL